MTTRGAPVTQPREGSCKREAGSEWWEMPDKRLISNTAWEHVQLKLRTQRISRKGCFDLTFGGKKDQSHSTALAKPLRYSQRLRQQTEVSSQGWQQMSPHASERPGSELVRLMGEPVRPSTPPLGAGGEEEVSLAKQLCHTHHFPFGTVPTRCWGHSLLRSSSCFPG